MTIERAFRLIHLLDVPESKRKFWPQWSCVVVNREGQIEDVIQHFEAPDQFFFDGYPDGSKIFWLTLPRAEELRRLFLYQKDLQESVQ